MQSYFFVPADGIDKLKKTAYIEADFFIADLEDSVEDKNYDMAIGNLLSDDLPFRVDFLRIDPNMLKNDEVHQKLFSRYRKIVYPKIGSESDFTSYLNFADNYKTENILIVEHSWLLVNLKEVISSSSNNVIGLAFGNHDYSSQMGVKLDSEIVEFAKKMIVTMAKAYNLLSVDVASMELQDKEQFIKEAIYGFELGYDSKLLIHPRQLEWLKSIAFYSKEEVSWARKIVDMIGYGEEYSLAVVDGKVIERPHIIKAKKILEYESLR